MNTEIKTPHWRNVWRIKAYWRCFREVFNKTVFTHDAGKLAAENAHKDYSVSIPQLRSIAGHLRLIGMDAIPNNTRNIFSHALDRSDLIAAGIEEFITDMEKEA